MLVLVTVYLNLVNKLLVYHLVLVDQDQKTVKLAIQLLVFIQTDKVLLSQFFFISNDDIELVLLTPDVGLDSCYLVSEILAPIDLIVKSSSICSSLCFVFISLSLDISKGYLPFIDLVIQRP